MTRHNEESSDSAALGSAMRGLFDELLPIHRTVASQGLRDTLERIGRRIPLRIEEVPSGSATFDWTVPQEWRIRDAWVADASGRRVIDYRESNLHVVGHSTPIHTTVTRSELLEHVHTRPDLPDVIPYRTSPYTKSWGFCARHRTLATLTDESYDVHIDADLFDGHLTYGECVLPGATEDEIVISTHACHPSLANDNTSGLVVTTFLAAALVDRPRRHTFRFLFIPGTIGSLAWLARNETVLERIRHGLVIAGVGDRGDHTYKCTFDGTATIDRVAEIALREHGAPFRVEPFQPTGYDERQYNSPGFRLPFGRLSRTPHGQYAEYHTSADDQSFVQDESLIDSLRVLLDITSILERDRRPRSTAPYGEPNLSTRRMMSTVGGRTTLEPGEVAALWVLAMADGDHSLIDVAERSQLPFGTLAAAADALEDAGLLEAIEP